MILSSHQPNFLPYLGFFYKMNKADVFVLSDDHQFSSSGMHNWNYIRIGQARYRIRVPVKYRFGESIKDVRLDNSQPWCAKLLKTLSINYKKASHFDEVFFFMEQELAKPYEFMSDINASLLIGIAKRLGINCKILFASQLGLTQKQEARIIEMCQILEADVYLSGIGGLAYNEYEHYARAGVELVYSDYRPVYYKQLGYDYIENLSILDWLFNMGFVLPEEWGGGFD